MTKQEPMKPSDFEFTNSLTFAQSHALQTALDAALSAMASYGSDEEHMMTLSLLRVVALKDQATALRNLEQERKS